jgi:cytidine deaminase
VSDPIDWDGLHALAVAAAARAYAPYSALQVGAAAVCNDGRIVTGCNIENASIGLTLCAECALLGQLYLGGGGRLRAFVAVSADGTVLTPCGRCRQLLMEHGGPQLAVQGANGPRPLSELLPDWFGPEDLPLEAHRDAANPTR